MKPSELLRTARSHITEPRRWTTGKAFRGLGENGSMCAIGALAQTTFGLGLQPRVTTLAIDTLGTVLREQYPDLPECPEGRMTIPWYNDHPEMTHEGMLAAFDKAALQLEEQGE